VAAHHRRAQPLGTSDAVYAIPTWAMLAVETRGEPAERPANTTRGIAKKGCSVGLRANSLNDLTLYAATFSNQHAYSSRTQRAQLTLHPFFARTCPTRGTSPGRVSGTLGGRDSQGWRASACRAAARRVG
jgi:hypothetical protein